MKHIELIRSGGEVVDNDVYPRIIYNKLINKMIRFNKPKNVDISNTLIGLMFGILGMPLSYTNLEHYNLHDMSIELIQSILSSSFIEPSYFNIDLLLDFSFTALDLLDKLKGQVAEEDMPSILNYMISFGAQITQVYTCYVVGYNSSTDEYVVKEVKPINGIYHVNRYGNVIKNYDYKSIIIIGNFGFFNRLNLEDISMNDESFETLLLPNIAFNTYNGPIDEKTISLYNDAFKECNILLVVFNNIKTAVEYISKYGTDNTLRNENCVISKNTFDIFLKMYEELEKSEDWEYLEEINIEEAIFGQTSSITRLNLIYDCSKETIPFELPYEMNLTELLSFDLTDYGYINLGERFIQPMLLEGDASTISLRVAKIGYNGPICLDEIYDQSVITSEKVQKLVDLFSMSSKIYLTHETAERIKNDINLDGKAKWYGDTIVSTLDYLIIPADVYGYSKGFKSSNVMIKKLSNGDYECTTSFNEEGYGILGLGINGTIVTDKNRKEGIEYLLSDSEAIENCIFEVYVYPVSVEGNYYIGDIYTNTANELIDYNETGIRLMLNGISENSYISFNSSMYNVLKSRFADEYSNYTFYDKFYSIINASEDCIHEIVSSYNNEKILVINPDGDAINYNYNGYVNFGKVENKDNTYLLVPEAFTELADNNYNYYGYYDVNLYELASLKSEEPITQDQIADITSKVQLLINNIVNNYKCAGIILNDYINEVNDNTSALIQYMKENLTGVTEHDLIWFDNNLVSNKILLSTSLKTGFNYTAVKYNETNVLLSNDLMLSNSIYQIWLPYDSKYQLLDAGELFVNDEIFKAILKYRIQHRGPLYVYTNTCSSRSMSLNYNGYDEPDYTKYPRYVELLASYAKLFANTSGYFYSNLLVKLLEDEYFISLLELEKLYMSNDYFNNSSYYYVNYKEYDNNYMVCRHYIDYGAIYQYNRVTFETYNFNNDKTINDVIPDAVILYELSQGGMTYANILQFDMNIHEKALQIVKEQYNNSASANQNAENTFNLIKFDFLSSYRYHIVGSNDGYDNRRYNITIEAIQLLVNRLQPYNGLSFSVSQVGYINEKIANSELTGVKWETINGNEYIVFNEETAKTVSVHYAEDNVKTLYAREGVTLNLSDSTNKCLFYRVYADNTELCSSAENNITFTADMMAAETIDIYVYSLTDSMLYMYEKDFTKLTYIQSLHDAIDNTISSMVNNDCTYGVYLTGDETADADLISLFNQYVGDPSRFDTELFTVSWSSAMHDEITIGHKEKLRIKVVDVNNQITEEMYCNYIWDGSTSGNISYYDLLTDINNSELGNEYIFMKFENIYGSYISYSSLEDLLYILENETLYAVIYDNSLTSFDLSSHIYNNVYNYPNDFLLKLVYSRKPGDEVILSPSDYNFVRDENDGIIDNCFKVESDNVPPILIISKNSSSANNKWSHCAASEISDKISKDISMFDLYKSNNHTDSSSSDLTISWQSEEAVTILRYVSTESKYDILYVSELYYTDNNGVITNMSISDYSENKYSNMSGIDIYDFAEIPYIPNVTYTMTVRYTKDSIVSAGLDTAYIGIGVANGNISATYPYVLTRVLKLLVNVNIEGTMSTYVEVGDEINFSESVPEEIKVVYYSVYKDGQYLYQESGNTLTVTELLAELNNIDIYVSCVTPNIVFLNEENFENIQYNEAMQTEIDNIVKGLMITGEGLLLILRNDEAIDNILLSMFARYIGDITRFNNTLYTFTWLEDEAGIIVCQPVVSELTLNVVDDKGEIEIPMTYTMEWDGYAEGEFDSYDILEYLNETYTDYVFLNINFCDVESCIEDFIEFNNIDELLEILSTPVKVTMVRKGTANVDFSNNGGAIGNSYLSEFSKNMNSGDTLKVSALDYIMLKSEDNFEDEFTVVKEDSNQNSHIIYGGSHKNVYEYMWSPCSIEEFSTILPPDVNVDLSQYALYKSNTHENYNSSGMGCAICEGTTADIIAIASTEPATVDSEGNIELNDYLEISTYDIKNGEGAYNINSIDFPIDLTGTEFKRFTVECNEEEAYDFYFDYFKDGNGISANNDCGYIAIKITGTTPVYTLTKK